MIRSKVLWINVQMQMELEWIYNSKLVNWFIRYLSSCLMG